MADASDIARLGLVGRAGRRGESYPMVNSTVTGIKEAGGGLRF